VTFAEISQKLGLALPAASAPARDPSQPIKAADYSLEFARQNLVPLFGPSIAVGDYDHDGHPDLYVVVSFCQELSLSQQWRWNFSDVTEKAGVTGPGASLSATFADFDNSGKMSLFVAGLDGVKGLSLRGDDGVFQDDYGKGGAEA
jgi:hypothetical protein